MKDKNLYQRLKPEHKKSLAKAYKGRKYSHNALINTLKDEYFFTAVSYGDAFDIMNSCDLDFLGDAFKIQY